MKSDMNILFIVPHYQTFIKESVEAVSKHVNQINVVIHYNKLIEPLTHIPLDGYFEYVKKFTKINLTDMSEKPDNITIHLIPLTYFVPDGSNKYLGDKLSYKLEKFINKEKLKLDLIHAHFTWPSGYAGVKLGKKFNTPKIITAHGFDIYDLPFRGKGWFDKIEWVLEKANHIITVSKSNFEIINKKIGISGEKISIIPNGFNPKHFKPMDTIKTRFKLNLPLDKKIILNVANLVPIKGHKYLLTAIKEVTKYRSDILVLIVGSGPIKKQLERRVKRSQLQDFVKFVGARAHAEIPLWMNAADIFVLPSLQESFGVVQIEAMACGKPVVATRNGGSEEIISTEDYGLLCEPANPKDLAEKILVALDKKWDQKKIRNYASQFTWKNIAKKTFKIYSKLCNKT